MPLRVTWHGHSAWAIETGQHVIQIDPFLDDNPSATIQSGAVPADAILVSHGHGDHVGDAAKIAQRTGATVVANYEIATWFARQGVKHTLGMNIGGWAKLAFGRVKLTQAIHSSQLPDGSYGGTACGFLLELAGRRLYFAGDTSLYGDMQLLAAGGLDLAVVPIGDLYTMGPDDALEAVKLLRPKLALATHYNTWPPIAQDAAAWAARVQAETQSASTVLRPGESVEL